MFTVSELADEHRIDTVLSGDVQNQQQPLSGLDAGTTADMRIPFIENWLQQPATQSSVDVMQQFTDQQTEMKIEAQSPLSITGSVCSPQASQLNRSISFAHHSSNTQQMNTRGRSETEVEQRRAHLAGELSNQLSLKLKSNQASKFGSRVTSTT